MDPLIRTSLIMTYQRYFPHTAAYWRQSRERAWATGWALAAMTATWIGYLISDAPFNKTLTLAIAYTLAFMIYVVTTFTITFRNANDHREGMLYVIANTSKATLDEFEQQATTETELTQLIVAHKGAAGS